MSLTSKPKRTYPVSASALNDFNGCPFKYKRVSLDKAYPYEGSVYTSLGETVHAVLEAYYGSGVWPHEKFDFYAKLPPATVEFVCKELTGFITPKKIQSAARAVGLTGGNLADYQAYLLHVRHRQEYPDGVDPLTLVNAHKEVHRVLRQSLLQEGEIIPEGQIVLDRWGRVTPSNFDKDAISQINADILVVGGRIGIVIDWKTGKLNVNYSDNHIKQVTFYAYHVLVKYPEIQEVHAYVIHPTLEGSGSICRVFTRMSPEIQSVAAEIKTLHEKITNYNAGQPVPCFEVKKRSGLCKAYCEVVECEENGRYKP